MVSIKRQRSYRAAGRQNPCRRYHVDDDYALVRYHASGTRDNSFGFFGTVVTNIGIDGHRCRLLTLSTWLLQSDGKIVVAGRTIDPGDGGSVLDSARYQRR